VEGGRQPVLHVARGVVVVVVVVGGGWAMQGVLQRCQRLCQHAQQAHASVEQGQVQGRVRAEAEVVGGQAPLHWGCSCGCCHGQHCCSREGAGWQQGSPSKPAAIATAQHAAAIAGQAAQLCSARHCRVGAGADAPHVALARGGAGDELARSCSCCQRSTAASATATAALSTSSSSCCCSSSCCA
jgi:hypothetical protein